MLLGPSIALAKSSSSSVAVPAAPSFKVLTLEDFPATQVSRKKNAELREATLRSDPLIGRVEPDRVFSCYYPVIQHTTNRLAVY